MPRRMPRRTYVLLMLLAALTFVVHSGRASAATDCGSASPNGETGEATFPALQSAIAGLTNGQSAAFYLESNLTAGATQNLQIPAGSDATIDLDGCTLTIAQPAADDAAVAVPAGSTVQFTDSSAASDGAATLDGGPAATNDDGSGAAIGGNGGSGAGSPGTDAGTVDIAGGAITAIGGGEAAAADGGTGAGIGGGGGGFLAAGGADGAVNISGGTVDTSGGSVGNDASAYGGTGSGIGGGGGGDAGDGGTQQAELLLTGSGAVSAVPGGEATGDGASAGKGISGGGGGANGAAGGVSNDSLATRSGSPTLSAEVGGPVAIVVQTGLNVPAGGTLQIDDGGFADGPINVPSDGSLVLAGGTFTVDSGSTVNGRLTVTPAATLSIWPDAVLSLGESEELDGTVQIAKAGYLEIPAGTTLTLNGSVDDEGFLSIPRSSALEIEGSSSVLVGNGGDFSGAVDVGANASLEITGTGDFNKAVTVDGHLKIDSTAQVDVAQDVALTIDGTGENDGGILLNGVLIGTGSLNNQGYINGSDERIPGDGQREKGGVAITGNSYRLSFAVPSGAAPPDLFVFAPTLDSADLPLPVVPDINGYTAGPDWQDGSTALGDSTELGSVAQNGYIPLNGGYHGDPVVTSVPASRSITQGQSLTDTATVSGDDYFGAPTGTVTFYVCSSSQTPQACIAPANQVGNPVTIGTPPAPGEQSAAYTPPAAGGYCFYSAYAGSADYEPATDSSSDGCFSVTVPPTTTTTPVYIPVTVTGPTKTVTVTTAATPAPPSNAFKLLSVTAARGGALTVKLTLPDAGTVKFAATSGKTSFAASQTTVKSRTTATVTLKPEAGGRALLRTRKTLKLVLTVAFTPAGGVRRAVTKDVTVRAG